MTTPQRAAPHRAAPPRPTCRDHGACVERALRGAEAVCARRGARLTELRRDVLAAVWGSHRPVGAYDVLGELRRHRGRAAPPTVYRALDFLVAQGLVHRIESRNAYVGCDRPGADHDGQVLVCRRCGEASELHDAGIERAVARAARRAGIRVLGGVLELDGICAACRDRNDG